MNTTLERADADGMSVAGSTFEAREGVPTMNATTKDALHAARPALFADRADFDREVDSLALRAKPVGVARVVLFISLAMLRWAGRHSVLAVSSNTTGVVASGADDAYDEHTRLMAVRNELQRRDHGFAKLTARIF